MPLLLILVLGLSLGEGFGQKPDDRLRISIVDLDEGFVEHDAQTHADIPHHWSTVVSGRSGSNRRHSRRANRQPGRSEATGRSWSAGRGLGVSARSSASSLRNAPFFSAASIRSIATASIWRRSNPRLLRDPTQLTAASIIEQVAQGHDVARRAAVDDRPGLRSNRQTHGDYRANRIEATFSRATISRPRLGRA